MPLGFNVRGVDVAELEGRFDLFEAQHLPDGRWYSGYLGADGQPAYNNLGDRQLGRQISEWSCVPAALEIIHYLWAGTVNGMARQEQIPALPFEEWEDNNPPSPQKRVFMPSSRIETQVRIYTALCCRCEVPVLLDSRDAVEQLARAQNRDRWAFLVGTRRFPSGSGTSSHAVVLGKWDQEDVWLACPGPSGSQTIRMSWGNFLATETQFSVIYPV